MIISNVCNETGVVFLGNFAEHVNEDETAIVINKEDLPDLNLGVCLGWFIINRDPHLAYPLIEKLTTQEKINALKKIINDERFENKKRYLQMRPFQGN